MKGMITISKKIKYEENHKIINGIEYKKCTICNEWLLMDKSNFYKNKSNGIDGYHPYCKPCAVKRTSKRQQENREQHLKYQKEYRAKNPDIHRATAVRFQQNKKEEYREYQRKWQRNNKDKLTEYRIYRQLHKKHNISKDEWENCKKYFNNECAYCGIHISEHFNLFKGEIRLTDFHKEHVDNNGANDLSNCIPSCKKCNTSKHNISLQDWYNENNESFDVNRINKIHNWLNEDYKKYIN